MMLSDAPRYRSGSGRRTHADKSGTTTPEEDKNHYIKTLKGNFKIVTFGTKIGKGEETLI